jgi:histidyl-tRNA synthetase
MIPGVTLIGFWPSLTDLGIDFKLNPRLVRGLDYYTHTAFEIQSNDLGAQATVVGGGRYDGLVQETWVVPKPLPLVGPLAWSG